MISNDKLLVAKIFFKSIIPNGIPKKAFFEDKICLKVFRNRSRITEIGYCFESWILS